MYTRRSFPFFPVVLSSWRIVPLLVFWSALLTTMHVVGGQEWLQLPGFAVSVVGTAVSFYLGFKGSSAYGRLWEARKIWGGIVNSSRTWGVHVRTMVTDLHRDSPGSRPLADVHRELIYRHVGWLAALRTQLRRRKPWEHDSDFNNERRRGYGTYDNGPEVLRERLRPFIPADELEQAMAVKNQATFLIHRQGQRLTELFGEQRVDSFRHMELARLLEEFYTLQGKCERIKNFPLPRQYATANFWFVVIFILLLPLGFLEALHLDGVPDWFLWVTIPASSLIGWIFYVWDSVLDYSENPFEGLVNDIPMDALSRTIEIDLRQMLGETDTPEAIEAVDHVLM